MPPARLTPVSALASACAGAAVWASLGTLALSDAGARAARVGVLPPVWWLGVLVAGAIALAWVLRLSADRATPLFFSAAIFVPWLPVRLPPELLVWAGPMLWLFWAAVAAGVLSAGGRASGGGRWRAAFANPVAAPWVAFACAAMIYGAAAWRLAPQVPGGDEPHYLIIAQSLWRDGDLRIENNHQRGDYLEYFGGVLRPDYLKRGIDGQIYSIHLPGVPAVIAPLLALGGYGLVKAFLALLSAAATSVAWRAAYRLTGQAAAAWFGWAGVALAAPVLLLSFTVYPDGPGAVVVMIAFSLAVALESRPSRAASWWAASGFLPALLPWLHPRFSVLAAALGLLFAGRALGDARPVRAIAAFAFVPAASAIGWFGYYYALYGRLDPSAAYGHYTQMSLDRIPTGLLGLLFDQQYGLIVYAPVFAIGLAGLAALARSRPRLAVEWIAVVVPYAAATAMYHMWWGGFSSPARFVGSTLLLFALPLAAARAVTTRAATRTVQAAALGVSVGIAAMVLAVERGAFVFNVRDVAAPWLVWSSQLADLTRAVPSLFRRGPAVALAEAALGSAALLCAWLAARTAAGRWKLTSGGTALLTLCAMAAGVTAGAAGAWRIEGASGTRVTFGQLRALEAAAARRAAPAVVLGPPSIVPVADAVERLRIAPEQGSGGSADEWGVLPYLPAGRYLAWADLSRAGEFGLFLVSGRSDGPFESWRIAAEHAGAVSRAFDLPVGVSAVRVRGDAGARLIVRDLWLQPVWSDWRASPAGARRAVSARRYGHVGIYAVSGAYLEPDGLWTAGGRTSELVVQVPPGQRHAVFSLRAGPVATPVHVRAGAFDLHADLPPGEACDLSVPVSPDGSALLSIDAGRSFRPSEMDPPSADRRLLGVRLEPRQNLTTPPK
jgi:hypothetical protein